VEKRPIVAILLSRNRMQHRHLVRERAAMDEKTLLERITVDPAIFGGKPIIRGHRLAVEHVLGMLAVGDTPKTILEGYEWLEKEDIRACLAYAHKLVEHERVELGINPAA